MRGKTKKLSITLTDNEYNNLISFLSDRKQSISEYTLMCIAVLLKDEKAIVRKENRKYRKGPRKAVYIKCSDYLFTAITECSHRCGVSRAEIVSQAIKEAIER